MKPGSYKAVKSTLFLQPVDTGPVVSKIKGSTKLLGSSYKNATVLLYDKFTFQPIAIKRVDENGDFIFLGLNPNIYCFCVALSSELKNARIFDKIIPE